MVRQRMTAVTRAALTGLLMWIASIVAGQLAFAQQPQKPAGYPKIFNIEMDPHEDINVFGLFPFGAEAGIKTVEEYLASVKKLPNPPAPNVTQFKSGNGVGSET
jgi:hypothetical protein